MSTANKTALLVIDVQQGLFEKSHPIHDADGLLDRINTLVEGQKHDRLQRVRPVVRV